METGAAETFAEFQPLPTTREQRGREIAKRGGIKQIGTRYAVPSQSGSSGGYIVDLVEQTCTCPDYELRRKPCKHQEGVLFGLVWEDSMSAPAVETPAKRKTYSQNWSAYNKAQTTEKARVEMLLKSLCECIESPAPSARGGRPSLPLRDKIFASVMKVYSTLSGRRATSDIRDAAKRGHIEDAPHYNSVFRCLESEETTAILQQLIEESAAPLAVIENVAGQFAQDSTGFSTTSYERWFSVKHQRIVSNHTWTKLHVMIGTATNVVTSAKVSSEADCPLLPELLRSTAQRFRVAEVSGDKAYLSKENLEAIEAVGAVPFIPFKINSVGMASKSPHWRKMWAHFTLKSDDFLARYHRRSNVESTMNMIKSKFGGSVRSKLPTAQVNEVLSKVLCHNLACIVHAIAKFDIDVDFLKPAPTARPNLTLVP